MTSPVKARSAVLALSTLIIVTTGAWLGADLKRQKQVKKVRQRPSLSIHLLQLFISLYFLISTLSDELIILLGV